jgi:hypothetical protein
MPSKRVSSARVDYVPALCTHRPSLLPIEWLSEAFGLAQRGWQRPLRAGKLVKLGHLEEVKVVTRLTPLQWSFYMVKYGSLGVHLRKVDGSSD